MKKLIIFLVLIFILFSCGLGNQKNTDLKNEKKEIKENVEETNLENYILLGAYKEKGLDIKYEEKNIEKIKKFLHKKNLSGINLENIKGDIKNILLLIKNNIDKNIELSITLKYSQLNDDNLSILMDYNIKKLGIMITCRGNNEEIRDLKINKDLGNRIINRKVKEVWIEDPMLNLTLKFEDKKQLERLKNDTNFEFTY